MTVKRMDNVGIVVEDLDAAVEFFTELGLGLEGRMPIDGEWACRVTGVRGQRVEIAMMRTPDGHGRLELCRFDAPAIAADHRTAPVNSLGYLRVMFTVEDIDDCLARLMRLGATLVDMEVGAVAQVAARLGKPWAAVKAVTDDADDASGHDFQSNLARAAHAAAREIEKLIGLF